MTKEQFEMLKQPFAPNDVQWRITATGANGSGLAVAYLDSRAIQKRLDGVIGFDNWKNEFNVVMSDKNKDSIAFISIISIYNKDMKEWISKSNGAGDTDIEAIKGGFSDAFKRAASMWGIGRYLYDFDGVWVKINNKQILKEEYAKLNRVYDDTVRKLFKPVPNAAPPVTQGTPNQKTANPASQYSQAQQQNQPPQNTYQQPQQNTQQPQFASMQNTNQQPCYTIKDAFLENKFTHIKLIDNRGQELTAFYEGEAKVAKNQRITNAILELKPSPSGNYYMLKNYNIAA